MAEDRYANIATITVVSSSANAITFAELRTNVGIDSSRNKAIAMIIDEIDYHPTVSSLLEMTTSGDRIDYGITISNAVDSLNDASDRRILHNGFLQRFDFGTAGSGQLTEVPLVYQFFPPIPTAERSLYLGIDTNGLTSAATLRVRIYYRTVELTNSEFLELAEVFRLVG